MSGSPPRSILEDRLLLFLLLLHIVIVLFRGKRAQGGVQRLGVSIDPVLGDFGVFRSKALNVQSDSLLGSRDSLVRIAIWV